MGCKAQGTVGRTKLQLSYVQVSATYQNLSQGQPGAKVSDSLSQGVCVMCVYVCGVQCVCVRVYTATS